MLEFMVVRMSGTGAGESNINIWRKEGRMRFTYNSDLTPSKLPHIIIKVPEHIAAEFETALKSIHIERWNDLYAPEPESMKIHILDTKWSVVYKEEGKAPIEKAGNDAFPDNWDTFIQLVSKLVSEDESVHMRSLARCDLFFNDVKVIDDLDPMTLSIHKKRVPYSEQFSIDRYEKSLKYMQTIDNDTVIKHEYEIPEIIDYLLGNCERYFGSFKTIKDHVERDKPTIRINLRYRNGKNATYLRNYDRNGLPDDWDEFLEDIRSSMAYYGLFGSLFDAGVYKHGVKDGEYIYLNVVFEPKGKKYYYRTIDDSLKIGDLVLVPTGAECTEKLAMITEISYCTRKDVPWPLNDTRFIIGRFRNNEEQWNTEGPDDDDDSHLDI